MAAGNPDCDKKHSASFLGWGSGVLQLDACRILCHLLLPGPGHAQVPWRAGYLSSPPCQVTARYRSNLTKARLRPCSGVLGTRCPRNRMPASAHRMPSAPMLPNAEPEALGGLGNSGLPLPGENPEHDRVASNTGTGMLPRGVGALPSLPDTVTCPCGRAMRGRGISRYSSGHPTGNSHPLVLAPLTTNRTPAFPPHTRASTGDAASVAPAGLPQLPQPAASQACPSEPERRGHRVSSSCVRGGGWGLQPGCSALPGGPSTPWLGPAGRTLLPQRVLEFRPHRPGPALSPQGEGCRAGVPRPGSASSFPLSGFSHGSEGPALRGREGGQGRHPGRAA